MPRSIINKKLPAILIFIASLSAYAEEKGIDIPPATAPNNISDLFANIRFALDQNLFLEKNFYTEDHLGAYLNSREFKKYFVQNGSPVPFTQFYMHDFSLVFPPSKLPSGIFNVQISTKTDDNRESGNVIWMHGSINIISDDDILNAAAVTRALGSGFREDTKAESDVFFAVAREPFNPPAKKHFIVTYEDDGGPVKKKITADFGSNDRLWSLDFSEERQ